LFSKLEQILGIFRNIGYQKYVVIDKSYKVPRQYDERGKHVANTRNAINNNETSMVVFWHRPAYLPDTIGLVHHWDSAVHLGLSRCGKPRNEWRSMAHSRTDRGHHWADNLLGCEKRQNDIWT